MGLYLLLASHIWPLQGEEDTPGGPGDAFYVFFVLWPFLLFVLVSHVVSFFRIIYSSGEKKRALLAWTTVTVLWVVTLLVDHAKYIHMISAEYT